MSTKENSKNIKHKYFMGLAFKQAKKVLGNTKENPAVGCVVVKNGNIINLSHTSFNGRPHAEHVGLTKKNINFGNSSLYTTLEPCSHYGKTMPCTEIIKKKLLNSVYYSKFDPDPRSFKKAKQILRKKNINVFENINKTEGNSFYKSFFIKKKTKGIFITSKLATSKDLFISHEKKKLITNYYSRQRVHLLRSSHDSIITTSKTILKDNSLLNCRIPGLEKYSPTRLIIDKNLEIPMQARIFKSADKFNTYLFYNRIKANKLKHLKKLNVKSVKFNLKNNHIDFQKIIMFLRNKGFYRLLVESGIVFNNFLLENNYINDFYHFYSDDLFIKRGRDNASFLLKKMERLKKNKKKILVNLLNDQLVKYSLK